MLQTHTHELINSINKEIIIFQAVHKSKFAM